MIEPLVRYESGTGDESLAVEALELASQHGLVLDEEQELVLRAMLRRRRDGKWSAFEVGMIEPRQNGKGGVLEARELAGIELVKTDRLIIHSAHEYGTALEAMFRLQALLEESGTIKIRRTRTAHGEQGFDFMNGTRLRYRTRTKGGGRGFSCDLLALDEAMELPELAIAALVPTMSARENPQALYMGSAVDQTIQLNGTVLARLRRRARKGDSPRLAFFEWALPYDHPELVPSEVLEDPDEWRKANPAMDKRITEEHVRSERETMAERTFAVERLGVGDWPDPESEGSAISAGDWRELTDTSSEIHEPICLAWDVSPQRIAWIAAAGQNADGRWHVEIVDTRQGTAWLPDRLVQLAERHGPIEIVCDERGPGSSVIAAVEQALEDDGWELRKANATENAQACGLLVDAVEERSLRHLGDARLENAIRGAATRPLGDAFSWARRSSSVDIAPLFAVTLALWAASGCPDESQELAIF